MQQEVQAAPKEKEVGKVASKKGRSKEEGRSPEEGCSPEEALPTG